MRAQLRKTLTRNRRWRTVSHRNPNSLGDLAKPLTVEKRLLYYPVERSLLPTLLPPLLDGSPLQVSYPCHPPATRGRALGSRTKPRSPARRTAQTTAEKHAGTLSMWSGSCGGNGNQRPKRKRWGSSNNIYGWDSDHLDQRPTATA